MRISPVLPATIAILLSACGLGEAEVSGSPIVATTTTTTTTIVVADEPIPDELAQADPAPSDDAPDTAVAGNSESTTTTTTTAAPTTTVAETTTTTVAPTTTTTTTTTVAAEDATDAFCAVLGDVARLNPFQDGIDDDADAYANFIRWEIDQLEMVAAPVEVSGDFASYVEAERRTLAWVAANGASLDDVRALGGELEATLGIEELADRVNRYFAFLGRECLQF